MHCPYKSIQLTIKKFIIAMSIIGNIIEFSSWISPVLNRVCLHQIIPLTISIDHFQNLLEKMLMVSTIYIPNYQNMRSPKKLWDMVMISSLASECQHFKVGMPVFQPFYVMKLKTPKSVGILKPVKISWPNSNHKVFISKESNIEMLVGVAPLHL